MSPLDRIAQLTEENRQLRHSVDELRAINSTAREELAREAGTIALLAKDKRELMHELSSLADYCAMAVHEACAHNPKGWQWGSLPVETARYLISRAQ